MDVREFKNHIYNELASITKAMANAHRLEIIDLLAQGAASVEYIAENVNLSIANASQHLQTLKQARLVKTEKKGKYNYYSLSSPKVFEVWSAMRELGFSQNAEIAKLIKDMHQYKDSLEAISAEELFERISMGHALALDVRPRQEYEEGHISGAVSIPKEELMDKMKLLPEDKEIVAYCRGPLCAMADEAVEALRKKGYKAKKLEEGYPDWKSKGLPSE